MELKSFLAELSYYDGKRHELQERAANFEEMEDLEHVIKAEVFVDLTVSNVPKY